MWQLLAGFYRLGSISGTVVSLSKADYCTAQRDFWVVPIAVIIGFTSVLDYRSSLK
jgi:hypothetical protein